MWRKPFIGACLSPLVMPENIFMPYTTRKGTRSWGRMSNSVTQLHDSNSACWIRKISTEKKKKKRKKTKSVFKNRIAAWGGCRRTKYIFMSLMIKSVFPFFRVGVFFFCFHATTYIGGKLAVCLHPRSKSWREDTSRSFSRRTESRRKGPNELVTICLKICQGAGFCFFFFSLDWHHQIIHMYKNIKKLW